MSLEATLRAILAGTTAVTDIVSTRIQPVAATLNSTLPYLTYAIDETESFSHLGGAIDLKRYNVHLQFWTKSKSQGIALSDAIYAALKDYRSLPATQRIKFVARTDVDEEDGKYEASHSYDVWYSNSGS